MLISGTKRTCAGFLLAVNDLKVGRASASGRRNSYPCSLCRISSQLRYHKTPLFSLFCADFGFLWYAELISVRTFGIWVFSLASAEVDVLTCN
jgi:hypothetical protein